MEGNEKQMKARFADAECCCNAWTDDAFDWVNAAFDAVLEKMEDDK